MGAWGTGPFDNDVAEDWVDQVIEHGSSVIDRALQEVDYEGADRCCVAIAAAEIVSAASGRKHREFPGDLNDWLAESNFRPSAAQVALAVQVVQAIKAESELADLWEDDPGWTRRINGLVDRLMNPNPVASRKKRTRKLKEWTGEGTPSPVQLKRYLEKELGGGVSMWERKAVTVIGGDKFTDDALKHLHVFPELNSVQLDECPVTDAGLVYLASVKKLRNLELDYTQVTGEGLAHLTSLPIRNLSLLQTPLTDAALRHVGAMPNMVWLAIQYTNVTDEGMKHLQSLKKLEHVDIRGTKVTKASMHILKSLGCEIKAEFKV